MKQQSPAPKNYQDFANESHIAAKKRAAQNQYSCKNKKQLLELIETDDEDDFEEYARYIK